MKAALAIAVAVLFCSVFQSSASAEPSKAGGAQAAPVIDIEPEECITRCFFIRGVPVYCYEVCF